MEQIHKPDTDTRIRNAKILFASGQLSKSIELFTAVESDGYASPDLWFSRGAALLATGQHQKALADFANIIEQDSKNERAYYFRGIAQMGLGRFQEAIDDLTQCLKRNNDRGIAHLARGFAYAELGFKQEADLDFNSGKAFSAAEINSFTKLFGNHSDLFENAYSLLGEATAPWNNIMSKQSADSLLKSEPSNNL